MKVIFSKFLTYFLIHFYDKKGQKGQKNDNFSDQISVFERTQRLQNAF